MKIADFVHELKALGFTALEQPQPLDDPYMNFYEAPERFADTLDGISLGRTRQNAAIEEYLVTFQAAEGLKEEPPVYVHSYTIETENGKVRIRHIGTFVSPFLLPADEELLESLRSDGSKLLTWLYSRPSAEITVKDPNTGEIKKSVLFADSSVVPIDDESLN